MAPTRKLTQFSRLAALPAVVASREVRQGGDPAPDAELIAVCAEFDACNSRFNVIHGTGPGAIIDDDEAMKASAPFSTRMRALLDRMEGLRATTSVGIQVRAHSLASHSGDMDHSFDAEGHVPNRLLVCLLRDAAALGVSGAVVRVPPDGASLREGIAA